MLISASYRAQNAALHAVNPHYGKRGRDWAPFITTLAADQNAASVLDYGCGKGTLAASLPDWIIAREYDPAIPGKETPPQPADIVVCTDVLEHIEPECLPDVIQHLHALTRKVALLSISLVPSVKRLPDGRSTHLIVETKQWWAQQLSPLFVLTDIEPNHGTNFILKASPLREIEAITSFPAMDDEIRNEHVRRNIAKVRARLSDNLPAHERIASLVCFAPSVAETYKALQGDIYCVGAAHSFLIDRGIVPIASIDCDPRARVVDQLGTPHKAVKYWLASCVNPSYLRKLEGCEVSLFHLHNGENSADYVWSVEPEAWLLIGGGSVGLRSISLLYAQGYRKFEIHGMDSSYAEDREYAGSHTGPEKKRIIQVQCKGRWFKTNPQLIDYARQFISDRPLLWPDAEIRLHGDGLLQEMCR